MGETVSKASAKNWAGRVGNRLPRKQRVPDREKGNGTKGTPIPPLTSSNDHFTPMNWVQVQSRLLSDVVYGLFLNGAPTDLCPLFSLQASLDHVVFPLRREMFFLQLQGC
ncbi:hypothetical protein fugu_002968 [Takifugu bimaculatus]|uniref:Uncharacterized protein n=1 Tax=Takifugu bimaculatus TaxID=433685 RepID=A0A4Z2BFA0_9TELE|nr:hypothetical protein fugu_002968 [Takifugu bimaculatus]